MKAGRYLSLFVLPFLLMIAGTWLAQLFVQDMDRGLVRSAIYTVVGVFVCLAISFVILRALKKLNLNPIYWGGLREFGIGLLIGLAVSFCSGLGFAWTEGYSLNLTNLWIDLPTKALGNSFPALSEELVFRGGVVEGVAQLFGKNLGLVSGTLPFGVLHLVGIFFGNTVTFSQILGISLAGLLLSLTYLRFGIWGSFACHLVWNSLVGGWIKVYGLTDRAVVSELEGSWVTCLVLSVTSLLLFVSFKKKTSSGLLSHHG